MDRDTAHDVDRDTSRDMTRARLVNLAGIIIGVAGIAFVTLRISRDREAIGDAFASATLAWVAPGIVTGWVAMGLIGLNWLWIMRVSGTRIGPRRGLPWFFVGQLGKYVPGGIWPIVGQAELAHRGNVSRRLAYSSTAWSMIGTFVGAATVGAITGFAFDDEVRWISAALAAAVVIGALAVTARPTRRAAARLATRVARQPFALPDPRWLAAVVVRHMPVWVFFSGMNVFAVVALGTDIDARLVVQLIAATCLSWMAGFVIIGLPGGLGVRETVFVSMMTAPLGSTVALSAAVISRVVSIVVDLTAAGLSTLAARRTADDQADGDQEPRTDLRYAAP